MVWRAVDFSLGQDDGDIVWETVIRDFDGEPVDLTGATVGIQFQLENATQPVIAGVCSIVAPNTDGRVRYTFPAAQTGYPGIYNVSFVVVVGAGEPRTYPTGSKPRYLTLEIIPRLDTPGVPWAGYWGLAFLAVPSVGVGTANVNLAAFQWVAFNGINQLIPADSTDATKEAVGITLTSVLAGQPVSFVTRGPIYGCTSGKLPGQPVFLGDDGAMVTTPPVVSGNLQQLLAYALNATDLYVHLTNWGVV